LISQISRNVKTCTPGLRLSWPPGELTMFVGFTAFVLIAYNGIVDQPGTGNQEIVLDRFDDYWNTERARKFARQLRGRFGLPVHEVDERYSTTEALAAGAKDADAASACIILEQYLRSLP